MKGQINPLWLFAFFVIQMGDVLDDAPITKYFHDINYDTKD